MANTIQHKRSTTASAVPSGASLSAGEIAINTADGRLFIKKSDGTVVAIGRDASELNTGTVAAARLPAATGSTLGAIIVGTGLGVASGTVSVSYGSTSSTACVGNDSRLSDTRTPTDGSVTTAKIADGAVTAAKIAAAQALSAASLSTTGNVSASGTVSGTGLSALTGGVTVSVGAITIQALGGTTNFNVSSAGVVTAGTWQGGSVAVAYGGTGAATAADARTNLGLAIGTNVQAYSATLAAVAGGTYTGATSITTLGTIATGTWQGTAVAVGYGGTGASTAANARTNLGLAIGTDVQAYSSTLAAVAGGTYTGATSITTLGTITTGTWTGTAIAVANGGTGATTAANALTNLGAAASSHTHGNISNSGAIGSAANLPVITGANGVLQAGSFSNTANSFCEGNDSRLACKAWVNFNGTSNTANLTGTYSRSGTTVTCSVTNHGFIVNSAVYLDFTSGTATDGVFPVASVIDANTFTITHGTSGTTSGNVTVTRNTIRASYNVSSVSDNGVGAYYINFTTALADANYVIAGTCTENTGVSGGCVRPISFLLAYCYIATQNTSNSTAYDPSTVCVAVFGT